MSSASIGWICLLVFAFVPVIESRFPQNLDSVNGGASCATCSILLGLVDKLTIVYNETAAQSLERLCSFLPGQYKVYCKVTVEFLGKSVDEMGEKESERIALGQFIVDAFIRGDNPDVVCHALKLCVDAPGEPKCRIYPTKTPPNVPERAELLRRRHPLLNLALAKGKICEIPGIKEICKILDNVFNNEFPLVDTDHDKFGLESTFRGSSWRGKDCNDAASHIHPGARVVQGDGVADHNCNGILGMDSTSGRPYEEEYCDDSKRLGVAVLGDSISAHFHLPEQWLDAREFSVAAFEHLGFILENELDWPQMSATTGHVNVSWPNIEGTWHLSPLTALSLYSMF